MKPNIHQFPENATAVSLLQYKIAVQQACFDGQVVECRRTLLGHRYAVKLGVPVEAPSDGSWAACENNIPTFNWAIYDYRIMAPKEAPKSRFFCFSDGTLFGPTNGDDSQRYCLEAKPDGTVVYLHLDGHLEPAPLWTLDRCVAHAKAGGWKEFDGNMEAFRPKPKLAEDHNPAGLTEDQVGVKDGWRLLHPAEIGAFRKDDAPGEIQKWLDGSWLTEGNHGWEQNSTYRTKAAPGRFLPKPKIAGGHNPQQLTEEQVEVAKGYRTLSIEEAARLRDPQHGSFFPEGIEVWTVDNTWLFGYGVLQGATYRTKRPAGFYLTWPHKAAPVPAPVAAGHNPENLTAQELEAEQGWRLLTTEEHEYLRSLNAHSFTRDQLPLKGGDLECRDVLESSWTKALGGRPNYTYRTRKPAGWYTHAQETARTVSRLAEMNARIAAEVSIFGCALHSPITAREAFDNLKAEGHNPLKFTNREVDVTSGWRLLTEAEIRHRASQSDLKRTANIQNVFSDPSMGWSTTPVRGDQLGTVYRTKLPPGHFLPRPKPTTVKGWLETLPAGYRERALRNLKPGKEGVPADCLGAAAGGGFAWINSPEGVDFWMAVTNWAFEPKTSKLPALPRT